MTLRHMKIFLEVYQNEGITKAANVLHLAQPSVSLAVKELENYYGICLFERIGRRIVPTEVGKEFYRYALHIISTFDDMEKKIRNWDNLGTLRIGSSITIGTHILSGLVKKMKDEYPELTVNVEIANSKEIEEYILQGQIDLGLIENRPFFQEVLTEPFMKDDLCVICAPEHELTAKSKVKLCDLAKFPFLMREKGSAGREILEASLEMEDLSVCPAWESKSTQAIVSGVSAGLGISVLPYLLVKEAIDAKAVERVTLEKPIKRELYIIYHRNKFITPAMRRFMEICIEKYHRSTDD